MAVPVPPNETIRLKALQQYSILDTLAEEAYDDITKLATFICKTPIALISLIDSDRQWFKSRVGLQATQTPREHAFCAHAILNPNEVLIVNDAWLDDRFSNNPLVKGDPKIRFYAGAPLITPTGEAIGTVCVIDQLPRTLKPDEIEALRALSRQVIAQLELRRIVSELDRKTMEQLAYQKQLENYQKQLEAVNSKLDMQRFTDGLTGVKNRRAFDQILEEEHGKTDRFKRDLSLLLIDIDKFKSYNDEFGHIEGDEALKKIAELIQGSARTGDFVGRYGGEEFAVILPNTNAEGAGVIAERIRRAPENFNWLHRNLTISIGVASIDHEKDFKHLLSEADKALFESKKKGGNRVTHATKIIA
jgi:diguanylate cyclase (GGDEF)-like protein